MTHPFKIGTEPTKFPINRASYALSVVVVCCDQFQTWHFLMETFEYNAFNLNIRSELPLRGLESGSDSRLSTVTVHQAQPDFDLAGLVNENDGGDFVVAQMRDAIYFWVDSGKSITLAPQPGADPEAAEYLMQTVGSGFALTLLLRQRGYMCLHACVLSKGSKTFGVVGNSGWGKSTLAEYFSQHGYSVLSDDIGVLDLREDGIYAFTGKPVIKLRKKSAEWLLSKFDESQSELDGRIHAVKKAPSGNAETEFRLNALYILKPSFASSESLSKAPPHHLVSHLISHTHGAHLLKRGDYQTRLLHQCSEIVKRLPVKVLERREGLEYLPETARIIEEDLRDSPEVVSTS